MKRIILAVGRHFLAAVALLAVFSMTAHAGILSTEPDNWQELAIPTIAIKVPNDPNILRSTHAGMIRDLGTLDRWDKYFRDGMVKMPYSVCSQDVADEKFTVHARVSNGTAGSGVKYSVGFKLENRPDGSYVVSYSPLQRGTYQQGLFGKYPVPDFSDSDVMSYLRTGGLNYKFEVNSPYPSDAVFANFERLASLRDFLSGEADPVTGKIFKKRFQIPYGQTALRFVIETYPYRTGSKAVIYANVPAVETGPSEVNYGVIFADVKRQLEKIAQD